MIKFTKHQYELIIESLEIRQSHFIVGDKLYQEHEEVLKELRKKIMTAMDWE